MATSVPTPSWTLATSRLSTRPASSARPIRATTSSSLNESEPPNAGGGSDRYNVGSVGGGVSPSPCGARSTTRTVNRSPSSIATSTRSGSPWVRCGATAREHASPIAIRISSSSSSATPARRATATATSRAVRTCAGAGENDSRTVGIGLPLRRFVSIGTHGGHGRLDGVEEREHAVQRGDPEDLQQPFLAADQAQAPPGGPQPLQGAHEHAEPGRVEELDPAEVDDDAARATLDELDEPLPQPRRGVHIDRACRCGTARGGRRAAGPAGGAPVTAGSAPLGSAPRIGGRLSGRLSADRAGPRRGAGRPNLCGDDEVEPVEAAPHQTGPVRPGSEERRVGK